MSRDCSLGGKGGEMGEGEMKGEKLIEEEKRYTALQCSHGLTSFTASIIKILGTHKEPDNVA